MKEAIDDFEAEIASDRRRSMVRVAAAFVAVLLAGLLTLLIWQTHQIVSNHNADIARTTALAQQIARVQQERAGDVAALKADTAELATDTAALTTLAEGLHSSSVAYLAALCKATPGCVPPPASSSP